MKPFRKNLAIAIDGGGLRGVIVSKALSMVEDKLNKPFHKQAKLLAGTSTGSVIASSLACGYAAAKITQLYLELGGDVFKRSIRTTLWPLFRYMYSPQPLVDALTRYLGGRTLGEFWADESRRVDLVLTTFDLKENRTRFLKPWKTVYRDWTLVRAIRASSSVPTYFPVAENRFVDGAVGSYNNPCYIAAYEAMYCLGWKEEETTLLSFGTGRDPNTIGQSSPEKFFPIQWVNPSLDIFMDSANDQQVHLVEKFFPKLDFRRFQVNLESAIPLDDVGAFNQMLTYGEKLGNMVLNDETDIAMGVQVDQAR